VSSTAAPNGSLFLQEVDATDRRKKTAKLASVWITSFS
jgi:hypothetical protein